MEISRRTIGSLRTFHKPARLSWMDRLFLGWALFNIVLGLIGIALAFAIDPELAAGFVFGN